MYSASEAKYRMLSQVRKVGGGGGEDGVTARTKRNRYYSLVVTVVRCEVMRGRGGRR